MSTQTVKEYQTVSLPLTDEDVEFLLPFVRGTPQEAGTTRVVASLSPAAGPGQYTMQFGPYVGRLRLPSGLTIDIKSRFGIDRLLSLLCLAARRPVQRELLHTELGYSELPQAVLATAFAREVSRLARSGLAKNYQPRRSTEPPYAGRFDATHHLTRMAGRADRLATVAKRLTHDIRINQILAVALDRLSGADLDHEQTASLRHLAPTFRSISRPAFRAEDIANVTTDRLTARYEPALGLAELIIRFLATSPYGEGYAGTSSLFYMPDIWEDFVEAWIDRHRPPNVDLATQHTFPITTDGEISGRADVVLLAHGRVVALWDAKYKWPDRAPTPHDLSQMVTYCESLGLSEATLVYPTAHSQRTLQVGSRHIHVIGLEPTPETLRALTPSGRVASHPRCNSDTDVGS